MENFGTWDKKRVVIELIQGRNHANELKRQLNSKEACAALLEKVLCSYDNALAQLNGMALLGNDLKPPSKIDDFIHVLDSPDSAGDPLYPKSGSTTEIKSKDHHQVRVSKKRKTLPKWSEQVQVRVCSESGFEGRLEDGYNWRKYGQKDILGATHPRAYYRCTHRHSQGCLATKQVQRSDNDPAMFEVVYRGKHSCKQERLKQNTEDGNQLNKDLDSQKYSPRTMTEHVEQSLEATSHELDKEETIRSFSFPSTPIESDNLENTLFSMNADLRGANCSSPFLSPETSDSYFDPTHFGLLINDHNFLQNWDFAGTVSSPTWVSKFGFGDTDTLFLDSF